MRSSATACSRRCAPTSTLSLQRLPLAYHTKAKGGDLTVRMISDVGVLKEVAVTSVLPMLGNIFVLVGMLGGMFWLNAQLALISLPCCLSSGCFRIGSRSASARSRANSANVRAQWRRPSPNPLGPSRSFRRSLWRGFFRRLLHAKPEEPQRGVKAKRLAAGLERTTDVLIAASTALVLYFGARLVLSGSLTPGDLVVFTTYLKNAFKPMRDFAKYAARLAKASAAGERVLDILDTDLTICDWDGAAPSPAFRGALGFENVLFEYEPGTRVLDSFTLHVAPCERLAIVGASEGGKSTLGALCRTSTTPPAGASPLRAGHLGLHASVAARTDHHGAPGKHLLRGVGARQHRLQRRGATQDEAEAAARLARARTTS